VSESGFCTHSLRERRTLGWDINEAGHAVCRGCGKPHAQSVHAAESGHTVESFVQIEAEQARAAQRVLVVTTNEIAGYRIAEVHGDVFGLIVRVRNYFSNMGASMRSIVGGEVGGYTRLLHDSRVEARARLIEEAKAMGANAVVAMRFDCNEIGDIMSEIACYGTAVTVVKLPPAATETVPAST